MSETLFKEVHYPLGALINDIGLPDMQRPFVWANAKVRARGMHFPVDWWTLTYAEFLAARRPLIALVIRQGYEKLAGLTN